MSIHNKIKLYGPIILHQYCKVATLKGIYAIPAITEFSVAINVNCRIQTTISAVTLAAHKN